MRDVILKQIEPGGQKWFAAQRFAKSPLRCDLDDAEQHNLMIIDATGVPFMIPYRGRIAIGSAEFFSGLEVADA